MTLRLTDARALHAQWESKWTQFLQGMPDAWKRDSFFTEHTPIIISCRYGQNQPVGVQDTLAQATVQWSQERLWEDIKFVSMALATHFE